MPSPPLPHPLGSYPYITAQPSIGRASVFSLSPDLVDGSITSGLVAVVLTGPRTCASPPTFDVNPSKHRERCPKHGHEKQERVSDVSRQVSHEADDKRARKTKTVGPAPKSTNGPHTLAMTEIQYTYLIGDGEQAVPSCLLPGWDDLSVQCPRVALECAVQRAEIHREHEHLRRDPQAPSCAVRREQSDDAVERNCAGGDDEQYEHEQGG